jgi:hypothetical protein
MYVGMQLGERETRQMCVLTRVSAREKVVNEVEMVDGEDDFVGWGGTREVARACAGQEVQGAQTAVQGLTAINGTILWRPSTNATFSSPLTKHPPPNIPPTLPPLSFSPLQIVPNSTGARYHGPRRHCAPKRGGVTALCRRGWGLPHVGGACLNPIVSGSATTALGANLPRLARSGCFGQRGKA